MAIDADGSPRAYHPENQGSLIHKDNAGGPGNWYGIVTDTGKNSGEPIFQGKDDPHPDYYVSKTPLADEQYPRTDPRRYVDSERIPYIAIPGVPKGQERIAKLGDFVAVYNTAKDKLAYAIIADVGPKKKLGEGSIALAWDLGQNPFNKKGKAKNGIGDDKVEYVVFPGSGNRKPRSVEEIKSEGKRLFEQWGGMKRLKACFP